MDGCVANILKFVSSFCLICLVFWYILHIFAIYLDIYWWLYTTFMEEVNKMDKPISRHYTVKQAFYIIENIYRAHEEDGFNELIPSWHQGLIDSLDALNRVTEKNQAILDYISYAEYLLSDMQLLELHPLDLSF